MDAKRTLLCAGVAAVLCSTAAWSFDGQPSNGERETLARVISRWDSSCDGGTRDSWDDMVKGWYDSLTDGSAEPDGHGSKAWKTGGFYHNGHIVDSDFVDESRQSWGKDDEDDRLDHADVYMVGLHGIDKSDNHRWAGRVRVNESGSGNCDAYQGHIELGDSYDLDFLHLSSCFSMDKEDWWDEWNDSFHRLHQIDGFHGIMWISSGFVDDYEDFADDAFDMCFVDAWIDNMYKENVQDSHDQCPIPRGVGEDEDDLWDRMDNEEYDYVFSDDPPGKGEDRWHGVYYVDGCDPKGKGEL